MAEVITDPLARECLRVLSEARGPLSVENVRERLQRRHGGYLPYGDVYNRLVRMTVVGVVESYSFNVGGARGRMFWPAP